jgi:hypothetical protein
MSDATEYMIEWKLFVDEALSHTDAVTVRKLKKS